jgi:hypothetical protein
MTAIGTDLRDMGAGLVNRVVALVVETRRTTAPVLLLRTAVTVTLLVAAAVALPSGVVLSGLFVPFVALAVLAGLFPRTRLVGLALLATAAAWFATSFAVSGSIPIARVLVLAAALYIAHSCAALAAVLPHDCVVAADTIGRWASRMLLVLAASLALGALGLALVGHLRSVSSIIGPIVGSLIAAGIAGLLAWQLRRPAS